ncbi:MAG: exonuclease SbcCD subunit D [Clostridia bacterium]|nr:exonuclease SbcCD subunit D [Clostridia bacterium]
MKFLHLSDLHLGKRLCEFSLIDDQKEVLNQIISVVKNEKLDAVVIAGDVYDKSVPSAEAVNLFDEFLVSLLNLKVNVLVISGNHDSAERIAFGSRIMKNAGVYLSPVYNGTVAPITFNDEFGAVNFYLLPFVKPSNVRRFYEEENINSYNDAVKVAVDKMNINTIERNVLVTHQFVTGSVRCDSEETVGGTDNVDVDVFSNFDYVALGHLHTAQKCGSDKVRYSGTPLKYSFSEVNDNKKALIVEIKGKNTQISFKEVALAPIRDLKDIRGTFSEITSSEYLKNCAFKNDYLRITLTDENDIPNAVMRLREHYKNVMVLRYDNARTRQNNEIDGVLGVESKSTIELFKEFFAKQNNAEMTNEQTEYVINLLDAIKED